MPLSPAGFTLTFATLVFEKFSELRAQILAHMPGSHDISQSVSKRRARDGGAHRVVLQPCAATSVSHNSLPKPSVWVPGREFHWHKINSKSNVSSIFFELIIISILKSIRSIH